MPHGTRITRGLNVAFSIAAILWLLIAIIAVAWSVLH